MPAIRFQAKLVDNTDHYPLVEPWILGFLDTDLNQDGTVNILDIVIVALTFGSEPEAMIKS